MKTNKHILMVASENGSIEGAKVGGIGDVLRDVPKALCQAGHQVTVVIPAYGKLHRQPGVIPAGRVITRFRTSTETLDFYEFFQDDQPGLRLLLLEHPLFSTCGAGNIYCDDPPETPFATDASKFALFAVGCAQAVVDGLFGQLDIIHLHDWHAAPIAVLRAMDPALSALRATPCVFSIHNLALQGIRPLANHPSSFNAWYPWLGHHADVLRDPRWPECINPVAAAIRLSDRIHAVSPTYANEIQLPNQVENKGFHGGEGLESVLREAAAQDRLHGILNGCDYTLPVQPKHSWPDLVQRMQVQVLTWLARQSAIRGVDYIAHQTLMRWQQQARPKHILTSVGRLTDQKVRLLLEPLDGKPAIHQLLSQMQESTVLILLGSGDAALETRFAELAANCRNFLFLNRYDQSIADILYASGDVFVMPSSFEPCGISQMIAMKHGQPCVVHGVGGLRDTVQHEIDGLVFNGENPQIQARNMIRTIGHAQALREQSTEVWQRISTSAAGRRFEWHDSATLYNNKLYDPAN